MAERSNPDNSLLARVIAEEVHGTYTFEVRDVRGGDVVTERAIAAPVGYHPHIVSLTWSEDGRIVTATIDYDFGDDDRMFELSAERAHEFKFEVQHRPNNGSERTADLDKPSAGFDG